MTAGDSLSSAELDPAEMIGRVVKVTAAALRAWIDSRVPEWPPDYRGRVAPQDPSYLIWLALDHRPTKLYLELGDDGRILLQDLRYTRNRWAHHVPFDDLDVVRSLDTCRRLLLAVGAHDAAGTVERQLRTAVSMAPVTAVAAPDVASAPISVVSRTPRAASHRRMRSPEFQQLQWAHRCDPHVAPINQLVDDLVAEKSDSWMPYIPAYHGGVESSILLIYQDPGPMTALERGGSGFLGCENDDPSAQTLAECLDEASLDQRAVMSWNAYPWYLKEQKGVSARHLAEGVDPLRRLLSLLPNVHTVVTGGNSAHDSWRRLGRQHPEIAGRFRNLQTFHTSGRGITNGGQQTKAEGVSHVVATLRQASQPPPPR